MSMTFDEAIARPEPRVGAWDYKSDEIRTMRVYAVGLSGASLLAVHEVATTAEREGVNDRLRERGLRIGGTHRDQEYVWALDHRSAAIWSSKGVVAQGTSTELFVGKAAIPRAQISAVETWFDPDDIGHRGVRCVRADGSTLIVVEERSDAPRIDPTYGTDSLDADLEWAYFLGQDLALWLDVPHRDQLSGKVTNEWMRTVGGHCRDLATRVERTNELGMSEPIHVSLGPFGRAADLALRFAPLPDGDRFLEVLTTSKAGTTSGRRVKQGTNAQIAVYLRQLRTPATVLTTMAELL